VYGDSASSPAGEGGIVVLVPDAPTSLTNDLTITNNLIVRFEWIDGVSNGGTDEIDYRITYDQSTGLFITLVDGLINQEYQTAIGDLTGGRVYQFRVEARNTVGYSDYSDIISILVA
jgi:hypothetical protein